MPRIARHKCDSGIYHIMLRGINRQVIFEEEEDKTRLLGTLGKYKEISKYKLYSYCLMDNHVHLLMKEGEEPLSTTMKRICSSYVYWYNLKYRRCGHLFQERYKSEAVDITPYFLTVLRYIHQNPMKAGLAKNIFDSKWASLNEYIHKAILVDTDYGLSFFSPSRQKALPLFLEYMQLVNDDQCLDDRPKLRLSDDKVRECLVKMGVNNISSLQQMDKENRDAILLKLKKIEGISIRQLARVTGISKSVIQRAREGSGLGSKYIKQAHSMQPLQSNCFCTR